jgi:ketosteroid isomerase-like protein
VPWLQRRRGPEEVGGFFAALQALQPNKFDVKEVIDGGDTVVAIIDVDFTVTANGRHIVEEDEMHLWRFGPDGKVARFRHGADTHMHAQATA